MRKKLTLQLATHEVDPDQPSVIVTMLDDDGLKYTTFTDVHNLLIFLTLWHPKGGKAYDDLMRGKGAREEGERTAEIQRRMENE